MDYLMNWKYIVDAMERKGIPPDSTELHEFGFFKRKVEEVWTDFFETKYAIEQMEEQIQRDTVSS